MNKIIAPALAGFLIGVFSVSGIVNAQVGIDVYGDSSVGGSDVDTNVGANASADMDNEDENGPDDEDTSNTTNDAVDTSSDEQISFSLNKNEAAEASIDAESAELSADAVVTSDDLSRFATSRMKRDAGIERIEASSDSVSIEYRRKARFLGFIPASIRATAEVASDGNVDFDYPWYRFLFSVDSTDDSGIQARISGIMAGADTSAGLDAHTGAQLIDALHAVLRGSVTADATA